MDLERQLRSADLSTAAPVRRGRITARSVVMSGCEVTRIEFGVGARWREDAGARIGAEWCDTPHLVVVLAGSLHLLLRTGESSLLRRGTVATIPAGHDAWTAGDEPCVLLEIDVADRAVAADA